MQQVNRGNCCKVIPPFTIAFCAVSFVVSLIMFIVCVAEGLGFNSCVYHNYLNLDASEIYQHGQIWRWITPHFVSNNIWMALYAIMMIGMSSFVYEKQIGTGRFVVLILFSLIATSLLCNIFQVFFGLIPGINSVSYFRAFWYGSGCMGPTTVMLLVNIFDYRCNQKKSILCCCCFNIPYWLYIILLFGFTIIMMSPIGQGIEYNLAALIVAFAIPRRFIKANRSTEEIFGSAPGGSMVGQQQQQSQYQVNQYQAPNANTDQGAAQPATQKEQTHKQTTNFGGKGRKL